MRTPLLLVLAATVATAQDGAKIFQQSCAVGYCHGTGGSANRAPRLAGRNFERAFLTRVVESGIPNTAMPGFKGRMPDGDLAAVIAYVAALAGGGSAAGAAVSGPATPSTTAAAIPAEAQAGKDAFFNPVRGTRCGTCHLVDGLGSAVGPNLAASAPSAEAIRGVRASHVQTAAAGGERFPALVVEKKSDWVKVFDLSTPPPVLRTLPASGVTLSAGEWRHSDAIQAYSPRDLEAVANYLRWLASR